MGLEYVSVRWTSQTCNFIVLGARAQISARHTTRQRSLISAWETLQLLMDRRGWLYIFLCTLDEFELLLYLNDMHVFNMLPAQSISFIYLYSHYLSYKKKKTSSSAYFWYRTPNHFLLSTVKSPCCLIKWCSQSVYGINSAELVITLLMRPIWAPKYYYNS